jgi:bacillithiol biosynthesis cysteine-adding enzyme BshC
MPSVARAFSSSYLAREAVARRFIPLDFRSPADRAARVRAAAARPVHADVLAVLREQQGRLPASPARATALDLLAGGAAVVATGQQVGLFLGPLYGLYKAASAVAVARALAREAGTPCVPLFWLQTEDHDFAEIAGATIAGPDGRPARLALEPERETDARVSIAHRRLGSEIGRLLDAVADLLPRGPAADETLSLLREHYVEGRGIAHAFAGVLGALFAEDGLLVLDPRDARLARLASPIYAKAIDGAEAISADLEARRVALAEAGFGEQIPTRARCALLFFHRARAEGPRFRLERAPGGDAGARTGAGWRLAGCDDIVDDHAIAAALADDPLRFSTSALLRPIVQDTLLPVAAYVGGPAELSYFAQLGPLYERYGLAPPLVVPRARFRCLDARTRRLLDELGLVPADLTHPDAELAARRPGTRPAGAPDPAALARRIADDIVPAVDAIASAIESFAPADKNLARAAARTRAHVGRALERLTGRYARTLAERDGVVLGRLSRLRDALAPGGVAQERAYAWPSLAGRHGPFALKHLVVDRLAADDLFSPEEKELRP